MRLVGPGKGDKIVRGLALAQRFPCPRTRQRRGGLLFRILTRAPFGGKRKIRPTRPEGRWRLRIRVLCAICTTATPRPRAPGRPPPSAGRRRRPPAAVLADLG